MCEKCKDLLNVQIGKKAKTVIKSWNNDIVSGDIEMCLDRYTNTTEVFIHTEETNKNSGRWSNSSFEITNCPFCGEKLI